MKRLVFLLLVSLSGFAMADSQVPDQAAQPAVKTEQYEYGMKLDVHNPVTHYGSNYRTSCGVVPARMTYEDSQGQRHEITYTVAGMGWGCSGS
ncbi:DUF2790 domain-containing protein [Azomonas macrocytogenes]|uniref:DUF2790 domain-containing protein n=1 Tax=Azomonas macrocytogenes TaxID=69962 RepID=A0A839T1Z8_AZOMA|nr:DUF2790 domain-containing protein [Azomonas macrocytogenes]MBB3103128.1 hypothetical protein [Azomonas macrocytogenes]